MARQHERLRVPEGWQGQARALIQQLERIHDDLYNLLGKGDIPEAVQEFMDDASSDIEELKTDVEDMGDEVDTLNGNMQAAQDDIDDLETLTQALAASVGYVATGDTHPAMQAGEFVFVQDHDTLATGPYFTKENIAANAALSTSNLGAVTKGVGNSLQAGINGIWTNSSVSSPVTFDTDKVEDYSATLYKCGSLRTLAVSFTCKSSGSGWQTVASIASSHKPKFQIYQVGVDNSGGCKRCTITTSGNIRILGRNTEHYSCYFVYFI